MGRRDACASGVGSCRCAIGAAGLGQPPNIVDSDKLSRIHDGCLQTCSALRPATPCTRCLLPTLVAVPDLEEKGLPQSLRNGSYLITARPSPSWGLACCSRTACAKHQMRQSFRGTSWCIDSKFCAWKCCKLAQDHDLMLTHADQCFLSGPVLECFALPNLVSPGQWAGELAGTAPSLEGIC